MKRIIFIKILVSALFALSPKAFGQSLPRKEILPVILSNFSLTEFEREHEENPAMVSNLKEIRGCSH